MHTKSAVIGLGAGLILGVIISPMFGPGRDMMSGRVSNDQMTSSIDRHFIEQMIPHHDGAIAMAELALQKSKRPEIISLANGIIEAQEKEIADMKGWYKDWFGTEVPATDGHMMGGHMMQGGTTHMNSMSGDMEALKNATNFDLEFVRQMIPHHEMAVMMAQMLQGSTERPEMKELADNIITSQTREIAMMRSWATAWSR